MNSIRPRLFCTSVYILFFILFFAHGATLFAGGRPATQPTPAPPVGPSQRSTPGPQQDPGIGTNEIIPQNGDIPQFIAPFRWDFTIYPYDTDVLQADMSTKITEGLRPAGIHVVPGESIAVLFVRIPLDTPRWTFVAIEPLSQVNADFSAFLEAGWAPVDITLTATDLHALFTVAPAEFLGWKIISQPIRTSINETMEALVTTARTQVLDDYFVHGITSSGNQIHVLYARTEIPPLGTGIEFSAFPNDGTSPFIGIDAKIAENALPVGIAVTNDWFIVAFYR